jgi:hypothetical protein
MGIHALITGAMLALMQLGHIPASAGVLMVVTVAALAVVAVQGRGGNLMLMKYDKYGAADHKKTFAHLDPPRGANAKQQAAKIKAKRDAGRSSFAALPGWAVGGTITAAVAGLLVRHGLVTAPLMVAAPAISAMLAMVALARIVDSQKATEVQS